MASAKWRNKWPTAPASAKTTMAKQPNLAPALAPVNETAPPVESTGAAATAQAAAAVQEQVAAAPTQEATAPAQDSTGPQQPQETACSSVAAASVPAPVEQTPASLGKPSSEQAIAPSTQVATEQTNAPEQPAVAPTTNPGSELSAAPASNANHSVGGLKVALLNFDKVGAPLADKIEIDRVFNFRKLEPLWVDKAEEFPTDAVALVTTGTPVGSELLARAPELKLVAVASDHYDYVDVDACKVRGIAVVNLPEYSTDATAELAVGFVLAHLRNLAACPKSLDEEWFWTCPPQDKLSSKTVGLIGVGSLGLRLAELFHAFSVKTMLAYSPTQTAAFTDLGGTYLDSLEELFRRSDVVCICCSLSPETQGLVSEALLELLSPSCVLVNVAHGGVIDEDALGRLLAQGRFRAGLDVFRTEPLPSHSPLRSVPAETLLATPHVGYQTEHCLEKRFDITTKNILAFQLDRPINRVA